MKPTLTIRSRDTGFTLVEVLIALAVFAIGSLGILAMITTSLNENLNGRQATEATLLGTLKLERLDSTGPSDTESGIVTMVLPRRSGRRNPRRLPSALSWKSHVHGPPRLVR